MKITLVEVFAVTAVVALVATLISRHAGSDDVTETEVNESEPNVEPEVV